MTLLRLKGGTLYDPANGIDGVVQDLWIQDGKIVAGPKDRRRKGERAIDVTGYVVMPGGVEMHCHIAGPKVNAGRAFYPAAADGRHLPAPTTNATGRLFAGMGYTTAMDAAVPPLFARHAHFELADTPIVDKGCYLLFANNHYVLDALAEGSQAKLESYLGWAIRAAHGYAIKLVNPGGIENWKEICRKTIRELDEEVPGFRVTPRQIVRGLAAASECLGLRSPVHIHCNNLGVPGNWRTTLETMKSIESGRAHFAHVQFHSYSGDENDPASFGSAARELIEYVRTHPNITVDVGHIHPGRTLSMTADAPFTAQLHRLTGGRWYAADGEQETSCGVLPVEYRPQKSLVHAVQWALGLEWYLLMEDPWRIAMTSDHPNGGAFTRYPEMIHLLMDRSFRKEAIARMPAEVKQRSTIADLDREYTLGEIAILTRAAPARILGLENKGHLGVGADADVTVYAPSSDRTAMFSRPRYVFRAGTLVAEDGEIRAEPAGRTMVSEPDFDARDVAAIREWFERSYTVSFGNYVMSNEEIPLRQAMGLRSG